MNFSCCGTDCSKCSFKGNICNGCNESKGMVFHCEEGKACRIYECSVNQNKHKNCSDCSKIPCDIWKAVRDPHFTDDEFEKNINERIKNLMSNKITGDIYD